MTREELAALVIAMLDGQQRYFRETTRENLVASKTAERELRKACEHILKPPGASLFD